MPSEEPLPPETGAGSTSSPSSSSSTLSETIQQLTEAERRLAEELELHAGVQRLARLAAIEDLRANLSTEAKAYAREMSHDGGVVSDPESGSGEDMNAMAGRDITVNHNYPPGYGAPTPVSTTTVPVAAVAVPAPAPAVPVTGKVAGVAKAAGWTLGRLALTSLLAGTGIGVPVAVALSVFGAKKEAPAPQPTPPASVPSENPFIGFGITIGKPE